MMSMNVWKRATLAIVRKPVRSGIIGLLMLMVFTSLVASWYISLPSLYWYRSRVVSRSV